MLSHTQTLHETGIFTYSGVVLGVNVRRYGIHGVSGIYERRKKESTFRPNPKPMPCAMENTALSDVQALYASRCGFVMRFVMRGPFTVSLTSPTGEFDKLYGELGPRGIGTNMNKYNPCCPICTESPAWFGAISSPLSAFGSRFRLGPTGNLLG